MSFMFFYFLSNNFFSLFFFLLLLSLCNFKYISFIMLFMLFLMMKMVFFSFKDKMSSYYFFLKMFVYKLLLSSLFMFFFYDNIFLFYIMFELISFMIFLLVYLSSFSVKRSSASIYMFIFMSLGTFPMLVMIFFVDTVSFIFVFSLGFMIKIPVLFFHLWLPKAHVEANYYDSMVLASLLLKLGGYGLLVMDFSFNFNFFFFWCLVSSLLVSFFMLFLLDMKMVFAFSSILHMNLMLLVFLGGNSFLEIILSFYMISHAFSSSLMFYLIGMVYEQSSSRLIMINKNFFLNFFYIFIFMFFCLFINMATPPFLTFYSEMYIFFSSLFFSLNLIFTLIFLVFMSSLFNLVLIKNVGMMVLNMFFKLFSFKIKSFFLIFEHLFYLFIFFY
uniref:NADH dehydrogenase subunit 4 n=1 Tax=Stigmaeopsis nanjingensis TaxID=486490 RepID=UPI00286B85CB|nr:NADH dehydrogenase subunit 4 [Stigmaeopsis nanjingensis]WKW93593.1 NADH dehydrogenase subunit 4 [Stigmaeopsis nanjingensis]